MSKLVVPGIAFFIFYIFLLRQLSDYKLKKLDALILGAFFFLVLSSAINAQFYYNQDFLIGITGQIKLLSIFLFYFVLFSFTKLSVTHHDLSRAILTVGLVSIVFFVLIHFLIPPESVYEKDSFIVKFSAAKGYYYTLPTYFFVTITLFYFMIKVFESKKKVLNLLIVLLLLITMVVFYKQRMALFFTGLGLLYICVVYSKGIMKTLFLSGSLLFVLFITYLAIQPESYLSLNSESWKVRMRTTQTILEVLSYDPLRLLFGSGNLSPLNTQTFQDLYGLSFWVSDVGMIGILFEYGLVGALFLYGLFIYMFTRYLKVSRKSSLALQALKVKVIIMTLALPLNVGVAYAIGTTVSLLAMVIYFEDEKKNSHA